MTLIDKWNEFASYTPFRFLFPLCIILIIIISVCSLFMINWLLLIVSLGILFLVFIYRPSRFKIIMFFAGIFLELPFYYLNTVCYHGWGYKNPTPFLGFPVWEPILFTVEYIVLAELAALIDEQLKKAVSLRIHKFISISILLIILLYASITFLNIGIFYTYWMLPFFVITLCIAHRPFNMIYFILSALIAPVVEIIIMRFGVWYFTSPYFRSIGFPLSLPLAYGISSNFLWIIAMSLTWSWKKGTGFEQT